MTTPKSRPNERCGMCGRTLCYWSSGILGMRMESSKESLCLKCYAKRGRDLMLGRDPFRRRKGKKGR